MGIDEIRAGALALSDDERAALADELLDSLHPAGIDPGVLADQLAARTAAVRDGTATLHEISVATATLKRMLSERHH
ncbi:MAG TPA: addiction module protein [Tepidiformaceae bacterium]|nr:addiction module protein [Tepidiformaceae bacterium]